MSDVRCPKKGGKSAFKRLSCDSATPHLRDSAKKINHYPLNTISHSPKKILLQHIRSNNIHNNNSH